MKKITLLLIMILMLSSFLFADDYEWNGKDGQYSFVAKFDFEDPSNCYSNIGFSQTPIIGDNTTPYENSLLIMKSNGLAKDEDALIYSASTFLYWHIAQGNSQKLVLEIMPTTKATEIDYSYTPFEDGKAKAKISKSVVISESNLNQTVDIASFTNYGRFSNSSPLNITIITKGSEERGVVAKLTLRLESL